MRSPLRSVDSICGTDRPGFQSSGNELILRGFLECNHLALPE